MRPTRSKAALTAAIAIGVVALVSCTQPAAALPPATSTTLRSPSPSPEFSVAPTVVALTQVPLELGEPILDAQAALGRILATGDWAALTNRCIGQVGLLPFTGGDSQIVSCLETIAWLKQRWGTGITVRGINAVPHFGLLEMETGPWNALAPSGETTYLNFHRYDRSGQQDVSGQWELDAVLYVVP